MQAIVVSLLAVATVLIAVVAISLQYHFSKQMAVKSATKNYQLTASKISDHLIAEDRKAANVAHLLAKLPGLVDNGWVASDTREIFAEVMYRNSFLYAIYLGFPDGSSYELVNLKSSYTVLRKFKATLADRWIVITVTGEEGNRRRRLDYLDQDFNLRVSREESSNYDASKRLWYTSAKKGHVYKTPPYLFQHLQEPGQTYSEILPSGQAVIAIDVALTSVANYLLKQDVASEGDITLFQQNGEIIASNQTKPDEFVVPSSPPLQLSLEEKAYIASLNTIRVSNEIDWPPIDYVVAGEPQGYFVDIMKLLSEMIDLKIEFVNGYSWSEMVELYKQQELEVLQPVFRNINNINLGVYSAEVLNLPYAIITRQDVNSLTHFEQLSGKSIAIPKGWSIIPVINALYPTVDILEVASTRKAILAVKEGQAFATLDTSVVLHHTVNQFFVEGVRFHENIKFKEEALPESLHLLFLDKYAPLAKIFDKALGNITADQKKILEKKWFAIGESEELSDPVSTVQVPELINIAATRNKQDLLLPVDIENRKYFVFVTGLNRNSLAKEYFSVVVPVASVLNESVNEVEISIMITGGCLLLLMPLCWLLSSPIVKPIRQLALDNDSICRREFYKIKPRDSHIYEINELSKSFSQMALSIQQHEREQKD